MAPAAPRESFTLTATARAGGTLIKLGGVINETFDPHRLVEAARGAAVIDLDQVKRITSFGVREWVNAMRASAADYLGFARCRPAMVTQFNSVAEFAGRGELLSFYVPFNCPTCTREIEVLLDARKQRDLVTSFTPPEVRCEHCKTPAQIDELPDIYFSYAASMPPPSPPPEVDAMLAAPEDAGPPLKVEKEVFGNITALWLTGNLDRTTNLKRVSDGLEGEVLVICDQVKAVTAEGVARLAALLRQPGLSVYAARVPPDLLGALAQLGGVGRAKLVSVRLPAICESCRAESPLDLDSEAAALIAPGPTEPVYPECANCGGPMHPLFGQGDQQALSVLGLVEPTLDVAQYLARQHVQPSRAAALGAGSVKSGQPFGRYTLLRPLGAGGMAEVFLARQTAMGGFEKSVVVKRILPDLSDDEAFVEMFLREARTAARLSHPNVVQIYDVGQVARRYYIAMEYVRGWDLNAVLRLAARIERKLPVELAARIVADVCAGLHAAHTCVDDEGVARPIIHRDVSPHNVLLSSQGQVKLTDFGIAKAQDSGQYTPTHTLKGKASYLAPEQITGDGRSIDARADIFPAGLILYQALTQEHMFRRDTDLATLKAVLYDPMPSLTARRPDAPKALEAALARAVERDPARRFQTAKEFQLELERSIQEAHLSASSEELAEWLKALVRDAEVAGQLPPEMSFTPTKQRITPQARPLAADEATPSVPTITGTATGHGKR